MNCGERHQRYAFWFFFHYIKKFRIVNNMYTAHRSWEKLVVHRGFKDRINQIFLWWHTSNTFLFQSCEERHWCWKRWIESKPRGRDSFRGRAEVILKNALSRSSFSATARRLWNYKIGILRRTYPLSQSRSFFGIFLCLSSSVGRNYLLCPPMLEKRLFFYS